MIKVTLISKPDDILNIIYTACKTCTSAATPGEIFEQEPSLKLIHKVIKSGHLSVTEHINFTFAISGISRACSHQLVRHRHCSFSQQSQRYVAEQD